MRNYCARAEPIRIPGRLSVRYTCPNPATLDCYAATLFQAKDSVYLGSALDAF
jgi:hypothetical protein